MNLIKDGIVYLDLFSGTGAFHDGIIKAGVKIRKTYFSEINKYAIANYQYNYGDAQFLGSITDVSGRNIEHPNLVTFGFPCQDLSIAGKRTGLGGKRSGLFFEAMRIIEITRPEVFIFENVKGLLSSNGGKDFEVVLRTIADLGIYECQWQMLNTSWYIPQNRERIYFVGCLRERGRQKIFPIRESNQPMLQEPQKSETRTIAPTLDGQIAKQSNDTFYIQTKLKQLGNIYNNGHNSVAGRVYSSEGIAMSLSAEGGGGGAKKGLYAVALTETRTEEAKEIRKKIKKRNWKKFSPRRGKDIKLRNDQNANTLTSNQTIEQNVALFEEDKFGIRRLTPIEGERLQGLNDNWTKIGLFVEGREYMDFDKKTKQLVKKHITKKEAGEKIISDSHRYNMVGNAVSTPVVKAVVSKIDFSIYK